MRGFFIALMLAMPLPAWPVAGAPEKGCFHDATTFRCVRFVRNYDGDTVTFDIAGVHPIIGKKISVRVRGIDTAEVRAKNKCEKQASRTARKLARNLLKYAKRIDLMNVERGKYFRLLADVMVDGRSLGQLLLKDRLAVAYDGKTKPNVDWCKVVATGSERGRTD